MKNLEANIRKNTASTYQQTSKAKKTETLHVMEDNVNDEAITISLPGGSQVEIDRHGSNKIVKFDKLIPKEDRDLDDPFAPQEQLLNKYAAMVSILVESLN